jgi:hypothetical protein
MKRDDVRIRFALVALAGVLGVGLVPARADAATITYEVLFQLALGAPGPVPSGTITFDDSDPLFGSPSVLLSALTTPYSFVFTNGTSVWTEVDGFVNLVPTAYFGSGALVGLGFQVYDVSPQVTSRYLLLLDGGPWRTGGVPDTQGTYSISLAATPQVVPEPGALVLLGTGLLMLARRVPRRNAGSGLVLRHSGPTRGLLRKK